MTELFTNVSDEIKQAAEVGWTIAMGQSNPADAAEFLNNLTEYYRTLMRPQEEIDFLQFYFNMKMTEMSEK